MVNSVMTKHNNKQRISKYPYLGIAGENTKEPVIVLFDTLNSGTLIYDGRENANEAVGTYRTDWSEYNFVFYNGRAELTND